MFLDHTLAESLGESGLEQAFIGSELLVSLQRQASVTSTCSQLYNSAQFGNTFSNIANGTLLHLMHMFVCRVILSVYGTLSLLSYSFSIALLDLTQKIVVAFCVIPIVFGLSLLSYFFSTSNATQLDKMHKVTLCLVVIPKQSKFDIGLHIGVTLLISQSSGGRSDRSLSP